MWWRRVIRRNLEQTEIVDQNNGQGEFELRCFVLGEDIVFVVCRFSQEI